jgi:hypothetical protein
MPCSAGMMSIGGGLRRLRGGGLVDPGQLLQVWGRQGENSRR